MAFNFSPKVVTDGLVLALDAANPRSYVSGSGTWRDLTANSYTGSLINGPTFSSANGGSIIFDGTNDYLSGTNVNLSNTNAITVSFFCKILNYRETIGSANILFEITTNFNSFQTGCVVAFGDDSAPLWAGTFPISVILRGSGFNGSAFNKNLVNDLKWHHWTCLFNKGLTVGPETFLYIDGISQPYTLYPFTLNQTNNFGNEPFFIGARSGGSFPSNIEMANLQIYNRALSAQEVLQNYNATKGRFGLT